MGRKAGGRRQNDGLGAGWLRAADHGKNRKSKGKGLPRTGGRSTAHVLAGEKVWDRRFLDRERGCDVSFGETTNEMFGHAEIGKRS